MVRVIFPGGTVVEYQGANYIKRNGDVWWLLSKKDGYFIAAVPCAAAVDYGSTATIRDPTSPSPREIMRRALELISQHRNQHEVLLADIKKELRSFNAKMMAWTE